VEFKGRVRVVFAVVRDYVEKGADEVEGLTGYVGDLEDGADSLADELRLWLGVSG